MPTHYEVLYIDREYLDCTKPLIQNAMRIVSLSVVFFFLSGVCISLHRASDKTLHPPLLSILVNLGHLRLSSITALQKFCMALSSNH